MNHENLTRAVYYMVPGSVDIHVYGVNFLAKLSPYVQYSTYSTVKALTPIVTFAIRV